MDPGEVDEAAAYCAEVRPWLVGALSLYCGDSSVAEEIAQDTLARVWDRWSTVRTKSSPEAWTYRVALNLARSHYRRRSAERRAIARTAAGALRDRTSPLDPTDAIVIRNAVAALPPRQKAALVLRYYSDLPVAETAAVLKCAPGTVKALTSQALTNLRASVPEFDRIEVPDGA